MDWSGVYFTRIVRAAQRGDQRAVREVLTVIRPPVVRYCRARVSASGGRADELAREVCGAVLASLPGYRLRDQHFATFVYRIAADAATRSGGRAGAIGGSPVDGLPARHREILILRVVVGLSAEEAGAVLGCTAAAIRLGQHQALSELRARVEQRGGCAR
ncbi:hypothetical protein AXK56_18515 [Tsukamurella pulmonis]|uniref:RNA polymerase sigma-70 factor, ECF subfamily n=1 Tax=Tsukamurella pulmonis TaxID=47312 RepID=A0A1H1HK98_9ACTN|nr:sigma factor-like helix-turn-helix DNA-binding protein [Tsukamurella pulmonis]KXO94624.1 hypothetical protein AXK56_18515 [Tsukamurella pulmonis]SDR25793.1 RNA polymerase sigma-70 factor, ECF subfamily [Tsukamurella pulmonis]SUP14272.1 RNA polymerase sigma factor SigD [Tsukamurella pulmonis]